MNNAGLESYVYGITALLPLAAAMVVFQTNPYHALVIRGILGAIAALVYAVLGAADVALTEALVGTLLAITLYAVAVRSSLVLRLGVLKADLAALEASEISASPGQGPTPAPITVPTPEAVAEPALAAASDLPQPQLFQQRLAGLRAVFRQYHLRIELVPYPTHADLYEALGQKAIHGFCAPPHPETRVPLLETAASAVSPLAAYPVITRLQRIHEILQSAQGTSVALQDSTGSGTSQPTEVYP